MDAPDPIDRLAPTRRPPGRACLGQTWSELGFLHWPVPAAQLRPLVPPALTLDTFAGQAWVGLVPFTITRSRVLPLPPLPPIAAFHEVNVRTYVHREGRDPGVWFLSLDAASRLAVVGARVLYHLPYRFARFTMAVGGEGPTRVRYASRRADGAGVALTYGPCGAAVSARPRTLEHFLAERYLLYSVRGSTLCAGRVHHPPYPLQPAMAALERETLLAANRVERPDTAPLVHYAAAVDVDIWPLRRVGPVR